MQSESIVRSIYPEAQVEERYYGKGATRTFIVFPAPWRGPKLGIDATPESAWEKAAMEVQA